MLPILPIFVLHAVAMALLAFARDDQCGTILSDEQIRQVEQRFPRQRRPLSLPSVLTEATIDVHFHVIAANDTLQGGYLPDSQIQAQVEVLNHDYKSANYAFKLVNTTRTFNETVFLELFPGTPMDKEIKASLRVGGPQQLNIYSVGFGTANNSFLLGYATFPYEYAAAPEVDGVVVGYSTLPGGSRKDYNGGQTLTHEVGHWFGLYHTFQGGCDGDGDYVDDTAPEATPARGCPIGRDTCPGGDPDPVHNYMDYSIDSCMNEFTQGQGRRMREQLAVYRGFK
ncbi:metalloprotease [Coprinopsis marcescibilis]|uniref:Metalloprotease n=1 Tax=Coprinopsis marcescibilis TaxID=230819 RepID=A0A5C3L928_COPMA|nr:metalloprotease [Coprinopsis marcescibilis]